MNKKLTKVVFTIYTASIDYAARVGVVVLKNFSEKLPDNLVAVRFDGGTLSKPKVTYTAYFKGDLALRTAQTVKAALVRAAISVMQDNITNYEANVFEATDTESAQVWRNMSKALELGVSMVKEDGEGNVTPVGQCMPAPIRELVKELQSRGVDVTVIAL